MNWLRKLIPGKSRPRASTSTQTGSAVDDWDTREALLKIGGSYEFVGEANGPDGLKPNEPLTLTHVGYSRYDSAWVYQFETEADGPRSFWLYDSSPAGNLTDSIRPLRADEAWGRAVR